MTSTVWDGPVDGIAPLGRLVSKGCNRRVQRAMALLRRYAVLLVTLLLAAGGLSIAGGYFLVIQDDLAKADLCLAMGGGNHRADYAVQLYHEGLCARLIFINGNPRYPSFAETRKAMAVAKDVPADAVLTHLTRVYSTYAELAELKAFLDADPARDPEAVMLISDPYHMRRTRLAFDWIFEGKIRAQMAPLPYDLTRQTRHWWTHPVTVRMVSREYIKLVYYWLRYRLPFKPLNDWLARFEYWY